MVKNLGHKHGPMEDEGTKLKIQTSIKKTVFEGNAEERDTPEAETSNEKHTKKGDRAIVDEEKYNNDEYT